MDWGIDATNPLFHSKRQTPSSLPEHPEHRRHWQRWCLKSKPEPRTHIPFLFGRFFGKSIIVVCIDISMVCLGHKG